MNSRKAEDAVSLGFSDAAARKKMPVTLEAMAALVASQEERLEVLEEAILEIVVTLAEKSTVLSERERLVEWAKGMSAGPDLEA